MSSYDDDDQDDTYWQNSKIRTAFNFEDDESKDIKQFAEKGRKSLQDDGDNDSLSGFTVVNSESESLSESVRYQRAGSARTQPTSTFSSAASQSNSRSQASTLSEVKATPQAWSSKQQVSHSTTDTQLLRSGSANTLKGHSSNSIADVVATTATTPTQSDIAKLKTKIKRLEIQLENQSVGSLAVEETIKRMLCGKPYLLESYRNLEDKKYLLKCALACHDGNVINAVIGFLRNSLNKSLFQSTLLEVGGAEQYISYLLQVEEVAEAEDIVSMIGKSDDAAMTRYRFVNAVTQIDNKIQLLKNCRSSHFDLDLNLASDAIHLKNQVDLLQIQQIIEKADVELEAQGRHPIMRVHKRKGTLPDQSMMTTLYYCCLYHYDNEASQFCSPKYLIQRFQKWYGGSTKSTVIGFHNVVKLLAHAKATPDTLIAMKDRAQLLQLKSTLLPGSLELQKANAALKNSSIKWRT
ncbi:VIPAS39 [Bugula neritina]|uniref:VIPAS39 n=1 Tax=Bugula neritina TaxID=10212 RepID=A0A7J7K9P1_BUGNE|nr:VIPAS39 [Bugula neritina]